MYRLTYISICFLLVSTVVFSQSINDSFPQSSMHKDLEVFKQIRLAANSGLYKYRTELETDSMYQRARQQILDSNTYREFFNILYELVDFEGSCHSDLYFSDKMVSNQNKENTGYFPYPIKKIEDDWIFNLESNNIETKGIESIEIPLGSKIIAINGNKIEDIIANFSKYYTTDGFNMSGKAMAINIKFAIFYRLHYDLQDSFLIEYQDSKSNKIQEVTVQSVGKTDYYKNVSKRFSKPFDYKKFEGSEKYDFKMVDNNTGILSVHSFSIGGNEKSDEHIKFVSFLDSVFTNIKEVKLQNLIVDIRNNGGGTDPNDLVLYEFLADRNFSENKSAWISFKKVPFLKYIDSALPAFLRPVVMIKNNLYLKKEFYVEKESEFHQGSESDDHTVRSPRENAFTGNVILLISPKVASAGSLFASLLASNKNTLIVGEETLGGYHGHNGHTSLSYILPESKFELSFSIVNLEQDIRRRDKQIVGRGIIPDYPVVQSYEDYLLHKDTQMEFTLELIKKGL